MKKKLKSILCLAIVVSMLFADATFAAPEEIAPAEKMDEILVQADATGKVTAKQGRVTITGSDSTSPIKDKTVLSDIVNISGDETFRLDDNGTLTWENSGNKISYIGTLNEELPFSMKITYYLNDQEITPEELAGKDGRVKVVYSFENLTTVDVKLDDETYSMYVPFLTVTGIFLPMEGFSNVESLDGAMTMEEFGEQYFMMGVTGPGANEALNFKMLGLDQYVNFPESFGFTADVTNFQMPSTVTCITPHVVDKLDLSEVKSPEDIETKIGELVAATEKLVNGSDELADGTGLLSDGIGQFMREFKNALKAIADGSVELDSDLTNLEKKKNELQDEASELIDYLDDVLARVNEFELPDKNAIFTPELQEAETKLNEDAALLIETLEAMKTQLEEVQAFAQEAQGDIDKLTEIGNTVYEELSAIDLDQIIADATELAKQQAYAAAKEELAGLPVTDEQIRTIMENIMAKVDVSSVADEARVHIATVEALLDEIPEIEIPEFDINVDPVIEILKDMEVQFAVLEEAAGKQEDMAALLDSANEFMDSVKKDSKVIKTKSNELLSGLDFADSAIQNAHEYMNSLKAAVSEAGEGSDKLANGVYALDDGAKQLAEGTEKYYEEGVLTAADYAKQATLRAFLTRCKAFVLAAKEYTNITGIEESTKGSIRFIIRTEAISVSE